MHLPHAEESSALAPRRAVEASAKVAGCHPLICMTLLITPAQLKTFQRCLKHTDCNPHAVSRRHSSSVRSMQKKDRRIVVPDRLKLEKPFHPNDRFQVPFRSFVSHDDTVTEQYWSPQYDASLRRVQQYVKTEVKTYESPPTCEKVSLGVRSPSDSCNTHAMCNLFVLPGALQCAGWQVCAHRRGIEPYPQSAKAH